jgi:hypothetical protein
MTKKYSIINAVIEEKIFFIRKQKVMLDFDLASLYGIETKVLVQALKRNIERFPADFMFRLHNREFVNLRSHFVTSSQHGGRRYLPYVFTEHGILMLSSILKSKRAVNVNIQIMRTFVKLRNIITANDSLARKLALLERKYDGQFKIVFDAIRTLINLEKIKIAKKPKEIGFKYKK